MIRARFSSQRECAVDRLLILSSGEHLGTTGSYHTIRSTPLDWLVLSIPRTPRCWNLTNPLPLTQNMEEETRHNHLHPAVKRLVTQ